MKRVLIVTYYWPPAGGAAIQRVVKLTKYLRNFGWEPIILTVENGEYQLIDNSFEEEVPDDIKVFRAKAIEPFSIYKRFIGKGKESRISNDVFTHQNRSLKDNIAKWIRMNLFIPDARVGWYFDAVKVGCEVVKSENIDILFSTSPPHSLQLIARTISKKEGIKWVADFRDPWSELIHNQNNKRSLLTRKIDSKIEKMIFRDADRVITVGEDCARCIKSHVNRDVDIIPNGYDKSDIPYNIYPNGSIFTITYTGELSKDRIPFSLIEAVSDLSPEYSNLRLQFIGNSCHELRDLIKANHLDGITTFTGYIPHNESVKKLAESSALLLVINNSPNNRGILTGKIFEYLGMKRPIICIGPIDGDAAKIIRSADAGSTFDYYDREGTKEFLKSILDHKQLFSYRVEQYEREEQVRIISSIFNSLTE